MGTSVALSGGGHRAALFGLGVLLYLVDRGEHQRVSSIASVSGGSITNGFVAKTLDFRSTSPDTFRERMRPIVRTLAEEGTLLSATSPKTVPLILGTVGAAIAFFVRYPGTEDWRLARLAGFLVLGSVIGYACLGRSLRTATGRLYGSVLAPTAIAALIIPFLLPGPRGLGWTLARMVLAVTFLLLWVELVLTLRGRLCLHAFRRSLFRENGGRQALSSVGDDGLAHVLCTTELQTGDHFYLSQRFVYSYQLGRGIPGGVDVAAAVQASAALPGAFPPQRRPTAPLRISYTSSDSPPPDERPDPFPSTLVLVDGGVYDNMADQWASGYERRAQVWKTIAEVTPPPERLIVVNASGGMRYRRLRKPWLPGGGELQALNSDKDVMYDQATAQRRLGLIARFDQAAQDEKKGKKGLQGVLVHIAQNPYGVPRRFANAQKPFEERAPRATEAKKRLDQLGVPDERWRVIARQNAGVVTTLAPLGLDIAARLIWHAYILAAVNLHVILGFDLPDALATQETVRRWVAEGIWK